MAKEYNLPYYLCSAGGEEMDLCFIQRQLCEVKRKQFRPGFEPGPLILILQMITSLPK